MCVCVRGGALLNQRRQANEVKIIEHTVVLLHKPPSALQGMQREVFVLLISFF